MRMLSYCRTGKIFQAKGCNFLQGCAELWRFLVGFFVPLSLTEALADSSAKIKG